MKKVSIKYNPYSVTTDITVDGKKPKADSSLNVVNLRLQEWIEQLPKRLVDEYRDSNFEISFKGTQNDYDDVVAAFEQNETKHLKVSFKFVKTADIGDVEKEIDDIYKEIQKGPIEELKSSKIKDAFQVAKNSMFEINVVATMSSGKSTLINALLGRQLMPAANEATTATIVKIIDTDQKDFSAVAFDHSGNVVKKISNVTLNDMKELNINEKVSSIEIKGKIPFVSSAGMKLVLVDTPGPNNSRDETHQEMTYKMLDDSDKSLVLYVMNAQQLGINDEKIFLDYICNTMKNGGKQARERYIFAVNKMDAFKPKDEGEDCIEKALNNVKVSLENRGIFNPNIFPVSAVAALEKRIEDDEPMVWDIFKRGINKYSALHFDDYYHFSHLPLAARRRIEEFKKDADSDGLVEIHTGIPSIEQAICQYINKYARTTKISDLVNSFNAKLNELSAISKLEQAIREDKNKREELNKQINKIKENIEQAKKTQEFSKGIDDMDLTSLVEKEIRTYFSNVKTKISVLRSKNNESKIKKELALRQCQDLEKECKAIAVQIKVRIESIIEKSYKDNIKKIIDKYEKYLSALNMQVSTSALGLNPLNLVSGSLADLSKIINDNTETKDESYTVRESYQRRVEGGFIRKTASFLSFGRIKDHTYETAYRDKLIKKYTDYVNMAEVSDSYLQPFEKDLQEINNSSIEYVKEETKRLKDFLKGEIDRIDKLLVEKLNNLSSTEADLKLKEMDIKKKEENLKWLEGIQKRVNDIINF